MNTKTIDAKKRVPKKSAEINSVGALIKSTLDAFDLNWETGKLPLLAIDSDGDIINSNSFEIYRKDTKMALGTVGGDYDSIQNYALAEILIRAVEDVVPSGDLLRYAGAEMQGGKSVYFYAALKPKMIGNVLLKRSVSVLNSHDGTIAVNFGMGHTFPNIGAYRQKNSARFRHSGTVNDRVKSAVQIIKSSYEMESKLLDRYQIMQLIPIEDDEILKSYAKTMFLLKDTRIPDLSTKRMNQLKQWKDCWLTCVGNYGKNAFALFMSSILYTNSVKADKHKDQSLMTGKSYDMNLRCFQWIANQYSLG